MRIRRAAAALLTLVLTLGLCLAALPLTASGASETDCGLRGWSEAAGWQYVTLGRYPYYEDGTEAPVLWQVLDVDEESGKALLLTSYIIDACQPIWVDDPNVAVITETGVVTGVGGGWTTIHCKVGDRDLTCIVRVK